ncbi:MAG: hypothetical protein KDJ65_23440 [Anaerolineae bacterium]|nr:hypothetical protein [Anaerolineae bacterium]
MLSFAMLFFIAATVVLAVVSVLLGHSLIRAYTQMGHRQDPDHHLRPSIILETVWTLMPLGLLVVLLILTYQAI